MTLKAAAMWRDGSPYISSKVRVPTLRALQALLSRAGAQLTHDALLDALLDTLLTSTLQRAHEHHACQSSHVERVICDDHLMA